MMRMMRILRGHLFIVAQFPASLSESRILAYFMDDADWKSVISASSA